MTTHSFHKSLYTIVICSLLSCSHQAVTPPPVVSIEADTPLRFISEERPPCLGMVKNFCKSLYSPSNLGKLEIPLAKERYEIRRGKTDNDFSQVYYEYAQTQLMFRDKLPREFRSILSQRGYFEKLRSYLSRKPRKEMSIEDRVDVLRLAGEIDAIWNGAMNETVLKRMERRFPKFSQMSEDSVPVELINEGKRVRGNLVAEISKAIWLDHPNWKRVERAFETVRNAYKKFIVHTPGLTDTIREDWLHRINTLRLMVPGGDPEIDMYECSRTEENAYYYAKRNYVTVCAGDFNAEDITHTLSHEVAHALDVNRSLVVHESRSRLGYELETMRAQSCNVARYSCKDWNKFKTHLPEYSQDLTKFETQIPEFQACLQKPGTKSAPSDSYVNRIATEEVQDAVSLLAEKHVFLRMITPQIPLLDGTKRKNPAYLDPCDYYLWGNIAPPYQEDLTLLMFFTAEYRCTEAMPSDLRFQSAIETAKDLQTQIVTARIRQEREFSPRWRLNVDGYAAPTGEKFADSIGGMVYAEILKNEASVQKRRVTYLTNTGWLCSKPSLRHMLPKEAAILKQYYADPHSETTMRQQELLSPPIRDALQCDLDFEAKSCAL